MPVSQGPILVDPFFVFYKTVPADVLFSLDLSNGTETEMPEVMSPASLERSARIVSGQLLISTYGQVIQVSNLRSGSLLAKVDVGTFRFLIIDHVPMKGDDDGLLCHVWLAVERKLFKLISGKTAAWVTFSFPRLQLITRCLNSNRSGLSAEKLIDRKLLF